MTFISKVERAPEHIAAIAAEADARARLASTRTTSQRAESGFQAALAKKQELIAKSAAGEAVTAQDIREVEQAVRDAEEVRAYAWAGISGAEKPHARALETLRHHEQLFFRARHRELQDYRATLACEADRYLDAARQKLAEIDDTQGEYHRLRSEADASMAAPLWGPGLTTPHRVSTHPLEIPPGAAGVTIQASRWNRGSEQASPHVVNLLGYR